MTFQDQLKELGADENQIEIVGNRSFQEFWQECPVGWFLLWLIEKMQGKEGWLNEIDFILLDYITEMMSIEIYKENEKKDTDIWDLIDKSNLVEANYIRSKFVPPSGNLLWP
jgi:hypothetical protein